MVGYVVYVQMPCMHLDVEPAIPTGGGKGFMNIDDDCFVCGAPVDGIAMLPNNEVVVAALLAASDAANRAAFALKVLRYQASN